jgi:glyoxylate/hydroxypyruvate reductase A
MALLIDIKHPDWMQDDELRSELLGYYPEADIRIGADPGNPAEIEMLTVSAYHPGEALRYPNLQVIQKTGAGVNNILADEDLPESIQVVRLQTDTSGAEMAEYALAYVLQEQRAFRRQRLPGLGLEPQPEEPRGGRLPCRKRRIAGDACGCGLRGLGAAVDR